MIKFLDLDSFCKGLKPVTSTNIITRNGEFDSNSFFSEIIFGTIGSMDRKTKFSYINLNAEVIHPSALKLLVRLDRKVEKFISTEESFSVNSDGILIEDNNGVTGITEFKKIFPKIKFRGDTEERQKIIKVLTEAFETDKLFIKVIPVIPVEQRPAYQDDVTKEWTIDNLNDIYVKILRQALSMKSAGGRGPLYDLLNYGLQKAVIDHDEYIRTKVGKKFGLIRSQLMGKRVDFSARAVITSGPTLRPDQIGIPLRSAVELFYPFVIHVLLFTNRIDRKKLEEEIKKFTDTELSVTTIQKVIKAIKNGDKIPPDLYQIFHDVCEIVMVNRVVLAKRDPVLHPESVRAFYPVLIEGNTIQLSTMMTGGFNADFDGDQMAVFHPLSKEAQDEAKQRMVRGVGNVNSKAITFEMSKDMCVGLYILTKPIKPTNSPINISKEDLQKATDPYIAVVYKNKVTTMGKAIVNNCMPDDFRFIDVTVTKKIANGLLLEVIEKYGQEEAYKVAGALKDAGFKFATLIAPTIGLDDIQMPPRMYELKEKLGKASTEEAIAILAEMRALMIETLKGSGLYDLVDAGATKGWDQPMQMLAAKGVVEDAEGNVLDPIKGSFGDGFTVKEYFNSASGARAGIINRVINTADTGYTSRQLVYLLNSVEADLYLKDCKTTDYLELKLTDDMMGRLNGRYIVKDGKIIEFSKDLFKVGDTIYLRTPIFCRSLKICHTCYGRLLERHKTPYIGILAGSIIGERSTQLIMRSFHTGGAVKLEVKNILSDIADNNSEVEP